MGRNIFHLILAILGVISFGYALFEIYKAGKSGQAQSRKEKFNTWAWLAVSLLLLSGAIYDLVATTE